jgi:hypothetical protein
MRLSRTDPYVNRSRRYDVDDFKEPIPMVIRMPDCSEQVANEERADICV